MKKTIVPVIAIAFLFLVAPAGYPDMGDLVTEGKELMNYSQQLIE